MEGGRRSGGGEWRGVEVGGRGSGERLELKEEINIVEDFEKG